VWSKAPVRRACSVESASVLTQCPCPFRLRMSLPCCVGSAINIICLTSPMRTSCAQVDLLHEVQVQSLAASAHKTCACWAASLPHLRVPHVDGGVLGRGVQQPIAAPPHAAHRQRVAGHAELALQRHLRRHPPHNHEPDTVMQMSSTVPVAMTCWCRRLHEQRRVGTCNAADAAPRPTHAASCPVSRSRSGAPAAPGAPAPTPPTSPTSCGPASTQLLVLESTALFTSGCGTAACAGVAVTMPTADSCTEPCACQCSI
jgi:hypothetical protein